MKALITGASSGIGMEITKYLASKKIEVILVARDRSKLEEVQKHLPTKSTIIVVDLANEQKVKELCALIKNESIDILVNNAGFGSFGNFTETELTSDLEIIDTNIKAVHILTKSVLKTMKARNSGYILNVSSSASFMPGGPLMSVYYATKSYISSLTKSIYYELKKEKSDVVVSLLCPGPVNTNFNKVAGVSFGCKALDSSFVAKYAVDKMMYKKQLLIIPGTKMKMAKFFSRFVSEKFLLKLTYKIQKKKLK